MDVGKIKFRLGLLQKAAASERCAATNVSSIIVKPVIVVTSIIGSRIGILMIISVHCAQKQ